MPLSINSACRLEKFGLLRYREGQHYDWHIDADHDPYKESHMRTFSVVTYLNDDFLGGMTEFADKARKPAVGSSLFFPSNWVFHHRAQPVIQGVKYVIVNWYRMYSLSNPK